MDFDFSNSAAREKPMRQADHMKESIAARAYELWQEEGCPEGRDIEFWYQAEQQLKAESADPSQIKEERQADDVSAGSAKSEAGQSEAEGMTSAMPKRRTQSKGKA